MRNFIVIVLCGLFVISVIFGKFDLFVLVSTFLAIYTLSTIKFEKDGKT